MTYSVDALIAASFTTYLVGFLCGWMVGDIGKWEVIGKLMLKFGSTRAQILEWLNAPRLIPSGED